jgi:hypothetical protein
MRRVSLPHWQDGEWWFISPWSGALFRSTLPSFCAVSENILPKVKAALAICNEPFSCRWSPDLDQRHSKIEQNSQLNWLAQAFVFLGNKRFLFATICAGYSLGLFNTTRQAFAAISAVQGLSWADDSCLQRSLLAAMTSKSFGDLGVLFIGAELSTGEMHAWIIENGEQPDSEDRSWINYRPLLALYK